MMDDKALVKHDETLPFLLFDKLDDDLIIKELEGKLPEILSYHFSQDGKEVWGLSKAGVDEATAELARTRGEVIRELEVKVEDRENEALFTVKAGRFGVKNDGTEILLDCKFGFKRQAKKYSNGKENPFWYEQGAIKACRNASFRLIPKTITQSIIEYAKKQGKVQEVKAEEPEKLKEKKDKPKINTAFLKTMSEAKKALHSITQTDEAYYEILYSYGYEHANEVKPEDQDAIIKEMRNAYKRLSVLAREENGYGV